jgi:hypothetical protein
MAEKSVLKLPKLKTRDELLRTAPELARLLAASDGDSGGMAAAPTRQSSPVKPRPRSPSRRTASPGRLSLKFTEDELTEEERVVRLPLTRCTVPAAISHLHQLATL